VTADPVLWHDLECGGYTADLALWRELGLAAGGPVLDVGAGTGRVALELAGAGIEVWALDRDPELLAAGAARAAGLPVTPIQGDARDFTLDGAVPLVLAPMQLVQLLGGAAGRIAFLERAAAHLAPGGRVACALAADLEPFDPATALLPTPDMREDGDRVLSSQPLRVVAEDGGWVIERVRQVVGAGGEVTTSDDTIRLDAVTPEALEREGAAAGLRPAGRRTIPDTSEHVGSEVVILAHA
jgi:SAM-dependent methyltransferase